MIKKILNHFNPVVAYVIVNRKKDKKKGLTIEALDFILDENLKENPDILIDLLEHFEEMYGASVDVIEINKWISSSKVIFSLLTE